MRGIVVPLRQTLPAKPYSRPSIAPTIRSSSPMRDRGSGTHGSRTEARDSPPLQDVCRVVRSYSLFTCLRPVKLDDQSWHWAAQEVRDIALDRHLTAKLVPVATTVAEFRPEQGLGIGFSPTQGAGTFSTKIDWDYGGRRDALAVRPSGFASCAETPLIRPFGATFSLGGEGGGAGGSLRRRPYALRTKS